MMVATRHPPLMAPVTYPLWTQFKSEIPPAPISHNVRWCDHTTRPLFARSVLPFRTRWTPITKALDLSDPPKSVDLWPRRGVLLHRQDTLPVGSLRSDCSFQEGGRTPRHTDAMSLTHRATIMAVLDRDALLQSDAVTTLSRPHPRAAAVSDSARNLAPCREPASAAPASAAAPPAGWAGEAAAPPCGRAGPWSVPAPWSAPA